MNLILPISLFTASFLVCSASMEWTESERAIERQQINLWKETLAEAANVDDSEKIRLLNLGLRNMAYRSEMPGAHSDVHLLHQAIQKTLLSIPGHAEYFAEEIESSRRSQQHLPIGNQIDYDQVRLRNLVYRLRHLPSPETIRVLGHYLDDERDQRPNSSFPVENAHLAAYSLSRIGLRNPPFEPIPAPVNTLRTTHLIEVLPRLRAWFQEVQSGERSFSFVGQSLEYRFQPDGAVEAKRIEIPDGEGKEAVNAEVPEAAPAVPEAAPAESHVAPEVESAAAPDRPPLWPWLVAGGIILLLALAGRLVAKRWSR